jgi:hypothetical protein
LIAPDNGSSSASPALTDSFAGAPIPLSFRVGFLYRRERERAHKPDCIEALPPKAVC